MIKDVDFGEIIIDGIPQKTNDATRVIPRSRDYPKQSVYFKDR